jgi:hypothetical protein
MYTPTIPAWHLAVMMYVTGSCCLLGRSPGTKGKRKNPNTTDPNNPAVPLAGRCALRCTAYALVLVVPQGPRSSNRRSVRSGHTRDPIYIISSTRSQKNILILLASTFQKGSMTNKRHTRKFTRMKTIHTTPLAVLAVGLF